MILKAKAIGLAFNHPRTFDSTKFLDIWRDIEGWSSDVCDEASRELRASLNWLMGSDESPESRHISAAFIVEALYRIAELNKKTRKSRRVFYEHALNSSNFMEFQCALSEFNGDIDKYIDTFRLIATHFNKKLIDEQSKLIYKSNLSYSVRNTLYSEFEAGLEWIVSHMLAESLQAARALAEGMYFLNNNSNNNNKVQSIIKIYSMAKESNNIGASSLLSKVGGDMKIYREILNNFIDHKARAESLTLTNSVNAIQAASECSKLGIRSELWASVGWLSRAVDRDQMWHDSAVFCAECLNHLESAAKPNFFFLLDVYRRLFSSGDEEPSACLLGDLDGDFETYRRVLDLALLHEDRFTQEKLMPILRNMGPEEVRLNQAIYAELWASLYWAEDHDINSDAMITRSGLIVEIIRVLHAKKLYDRNIHLTINIYKNIILHKDKNSTSYGLLYELDGNFNLFFDIIESAMNHQKTFLGGDVDIEAFSLLHKFSEELSSEIKNEIWSALISLNQQKLQFPECKAILIEIINRLEVINSKNINAMPRLLDMYRRSIADDKGQVYSSALFEASNKNWRLYINILIFTVNHIQRRKGDPNIVSLEGMKGLPKSRLDELGIEFDHAMSVFRKKNKSTDDWQGNVYELIDFRLSLTQHINENQSEVSMFYFLMWDYFNLMSEDGTDNLEFDRNTLSFEIGNIEEFITILSMSQRHISLLSTQGQSVANFIKGLPDFSIPVIIREFQEEINLLTNDKKTGKNWMRRAAYAIEWLVQLTVPDVGLLGQDKARAELWRRLPDTP